MASLSHTHGPAHLSCMVIQVMHSLPPDALSGHLWEQELDTDWWVGRPWVRKLWGTWWGAGTDEIWRHMRDNKQGEASQKWGRVKWTTRETQMEKGRKEVK